MIAEGKKAPAFAGVDSNGNAVKLSQFKGQKVVLYFYPKDDTPGCTKEACSFRDSFKAYKAKKVVVLGVSPDSQSSHLKFAKKYDLPFTLVSDPDHSIAEAYGVWGKKKFMGREYMGVNRTTFVIDEGGKIAKIYEKVKPENHAEEILETISEKG